MEKAEKYVDNLKKSGKFKRLEELAQSPLGQQVESHIDMESLEQAAKTGNYEEMQKIIGNVLRSQEGKQLLEGIHRLLEH